MYTKKIFSLAMAAFLSAMAVFPVYAGTEKIDTVRLEFSYDKEPESGDDIGDISVRARDDSYDVDSVEYTNLEDKDVTDRLEHINPSLAAQARVVLDINKSERHIRGGLATREKYQHRLAICSKENS